MKASAIILAGGLSKRFGQDKVLIPLANKPLIRYVLEAVHQVVDEKIVVVGSETNVAQLFKVSDLNFKVVTDRYDLQGPLVGAATGLEAARGEYAFILPCDSPLVSREVLRLLLELCGDRNAVIPRWPNGYIEPLHAVYRVKPALEAAKKALEEGKLEMRSLIEKLRGTRYISTLVIQQLDPELKTFFNINTLIDLKRVERMLKTGA